ncbi:MAG: Spy/CpxP family protein refolding chaperone [Gallionella sp.]|nr:Spy/CpxP family protein refolding chaperone [Gallionella sp.]
MSMKNIVFFLAFGLCAGYSGISIAADSPATKPAVSKPSVKSTAQNAPKGGMMEHKMCDHMKGMMTKSDGGRMGGMMGGETGVVKTDQMCDHMRGMKDGQMCDHMGGAKGGHKCEHMGGEMGGMKGGQMCDHMGGMKGSHETGATMESPHIGMVMALDLSGEQRSRINKLSDELRHNNWTAMGLIMDESAKLRDLYGADKRDPSAIGMEYQKIFDLKRRMIEAMIDTQNRVEELLTPEQRAQLKDMHHKMGSMPCNPKQ